MVLWLSTLACLVSTAAVAGLDYVVPPGQEGRIEALFAPYSGGADHRGSVVEGISLHSDRIELRLKGADGGSGALLFKHRSKEEEGDTMLPSFAATLPRDGGPGVEALARALVEAAKAKDKGDFPWRAIDEPPPPPPEPERGPWLLSWLAGTGWALLLWLSLAALGLVWLWRERPLRKARGLLSDRWLLLTLAVVGVGAALRTWLAPEAIYKEAHPFRGIDSAFISVGIPVEELDYPPGMAALLQLLHSIGGWHPVELLFSVNLALGCLLPLLMAALGKRLHGTSRAAFLYAAIAALLPQAIKYSHSEALTVSYATLLAFCLLAALETGRSLLAALLCGLGCALLTHLRPEGAMAWPGVALVAFAASREHAGSAGRRWGRLGLGGLVGLAAGTPALLRVLELQRSGIGLGGGPEIEAAKRPTLWTSAGHFFEPGFNVFISYEHTPVLVIALLCMGLVPLLRRGWLGIGALLAGIPLMLTYGLIESSVPRFGEMRYHLAAAPVALVAAGHGAVLLVDLLKSPRLQRAATLGLVALMAVSTATRAGDVRWAEHPFQTELDVLRRNVLDGQAGWELGAMVLVPEREPRIHQDLLPHAMRSLLVHRDLEMKLGSWGDLSKPAPPGASRPPTFVYRGLYAHYLSGGGEDPDEVFAERMRRHGVALKPGSAPHLEPVFVERRPFVPHHSLLDRERSPAEVTFALYRLRWSGG